ncbi:PD-(D/E)XK nuclease family protein [Pseudenhygromyxa sp. WMMC2535]|uniref:PD-(D/E)XK nuclease family protein n=1 Tax=Pseudenhygromyxa sp. WMMC2535 TaxID=2712867 RepID=UPI0015518C0A|nr:PD-(D/E)XK nuclease family protein [Pseudenhygromyxa sp. WMMC2535]NVB42949.1 PD-(D/E)XK nuclease family protein [Pseudenhygromyxa sp. WMMC2535]
MSLGRAAPPERVLRVLPTREHVAEALRERVRAQGVALALGLIDLRSLEDRLLRACALEPVGTTEARLALAAVAPAAARGTTLAQLAREPGFAESFLVLWDNLRRAGLDARGFSQLAARLSRRGQSLTGRRFTALAEIATAYETKLGQRGVFDGVGARARLPERVADRERLGDARLRALVDGASCLEVVVGGELPVIRARLWQALARRGLQVRAEVPVLPPALAGAELGGAGLTTELATALEILRRNLVEEAPAVELISRPLTGEGAGPLAAAGLIPFVPETQAARLVDPALRGKLELIDAGDERAELRSACAKIRALLQAKVAPHRITVALPRLGIARARVLAAFDAAEIPVEESRGQPVMDAAPLRLAFALIEAAERDLPREALAAVLESAYVARRDAPLLLAALRDAGSRDDRGVGHLGRLRAHAAKLAQPSPFGLDKPERRAAKSARYFMLADRWERLFERLRLPRRATLRAHLDAVFAALRALGIPRRCLSLPDLGQGSRERRLERDAVAALARDRAALESLEIAGHGLDQAAAAVGLADEPVPLADFRAHLEAALAGVRERPPGVRGAGVALRDLDEVAGSRCDVLVLLHAVEGELPGPGRPLPFLDEDDRAALDRAAGRPVLAAVRGADAGAFAMAMAAVRGRAMITCHRQDAGGREVVRSRYFVALATALGHASVEPRPAGVVPSLVECSARGQVLTRVVMLRTSPDSARARLEAAARTRPELARALDWAQARAETLEGAQINLDGPALDRAHARLGFVWSGERPPVPESKPEPAPEPALATLPLTPGLVWRGSATSLEDYAACPFRFHAARVLHLRPRPSIRDDLSTAEQGSIRHEVLAAAMQAMRREGLTPLIGGDQTQREDRRAHEICEEILDRWQGVERTGPWPLWLLHRDLVHRDLGRLLEGERRVAIEGWEPEEFERGFGLPDPEAPARIEGPPLAIPDRRGARRLELVGRVDRIDYRGDRREREGLILDYKSGRVGDRLRYDQLARTQLQLPLYAAWLATRHPELGYTDAAYVSLRDGERSRASLLDLSLSSMELDGLLELDPATRAELRARRFEPSGELGALDDADEAPDMDTGTDPRAATDAERDGLVAVGALDLPTTGQRNLADNVWSLLAGVAAGRFDVRPYDPGRVCRYCPYGAICRVERGDDREEPSA